MRLFYSESILISVLSVRLFYSESILISVLSVRLFYSESILISVLSGAGHKCIHSVPLPKDHMDCSKLFLLAMVFLSSS